MRKIIIAILFLSCFSPLVVEADNSSESSSQTENGKKIRLGPKDPKDGRQRMPAMPIYGYYSCGTLRLEISDAIDEVYLLRIYDTEGIITYESNFTVGNLIEGVSVVLTADSHIELVTSSGKTYSEQ